MKDEQTTETVAEVSREIEAAIEALLSRVVTLRRIQSVYARGGSEAAAAVMVGLAAMEEHADRIPF